MRATGERLGVSVEKMSKAKLNGISPDDVVRAYGADVMRLYEMFMGEFELPKPWDTRAIEGVNRFLKRVWRLVEEWQPPKSPAGDPNVIRRHKTIKRVTEDLERLKFNTAIAAMMELVNDLVSGGATREDLLVLIKLISPFAPHMADEAWETLGEGGFVLQSSWPAYDVALTRDAMLTLGVQVNGKLRASFDVERDAPEARLRELALALPNVARHTAGKTVRKVIVVPGKIVNVVVV